ncbi:hypothetical protein CBR_g15 [Chara braunii]|uniref:Uncharacterized protein n=1 Tax=Chara braunii TaxID=69332 RepID=A0A388JLK7_CHABU|nr:hypothetical protein CBR_g15 [Chara braunii]|eukprot:GBG58615.1 hypothetical protein CBR_g15 [Chara braunii]
MLNLTDLRKVSRKSFGTTKQFLTEFEQVTKLVPDLPNKDRCFIFLDNFTEVEQLKLVKGMKERYDWPKIRENLLAGDFDQILYRLLKQQEENRERLQLGTDKDKQFYKTLSDMREMMSSMKEERLKLQVMMVKAKTWKRKGKEPVTEESSSASESESEEEREPPLPLDGFQEGEELHLSINSYNYLADAMTRHGKTIWNAPCFHHVRSELVIGESFIEEDPWGERTSEQMMNLALSDEVELIKEPLAIEYGHEQTDKTFRITGEISFLVNSLIDEDHLKMMNEEAEGSEIREAFREGEYDGEYRLMRMWLNGELRDDEVDPAVRQKSDLICVLLNLLIHNMSLSQEQ